MATNPLAGLLEALKDYFDWDAPDDAIARFRYYVENGKVRKARSCLGSPHRRSFLLEGDPPPLHIAAARGDARMVELLLTFPDNWRAATTLELRRGSRWRDPATQDLFALTDCPKNALALARLSGSAETYRLLLQDAEPVELDWALHAATLKRDLPWMTELVRRGASANAPAVYSFDGWTPFLRAVKHDFLAGVEYLLANGADVRRGYRPPNYGHDNDTIEFYSPLYLACLNANRRIAEILLDAGADADQGLVDCCDELIHTPLMAAFDNGLPEIGRLLVERGADPARAARKWRDGLSVREVYRAAPDPRWSFLAAR